MKINCYGLSKNEQPFYEAEAKKVNYEITFIDSQLNLDTLQNITQDVQGIIISPSDDINFDLLNNLKNKTSVKYITTSSAGFDHIDTKAASSLGFKIGRIPAYSPTSVASWAFTTGLGLLRGTNQMFYRASHSDFTVDDLQPIKEFKNLTVGVIGTGKIGYETIKYFSGVGLNKLLANDIFENDAVKSLANYVDLDTLLAESDLVVLHIPYIKGENDNFVNSEFLNKMKAGSSLVNASRAALANESDILEALKANKLAYFATDVFLSEDKILGVKFDDQKELEKLNPTLVKWIELYPRILVSQHLAYYTDEAIKNMAQTTILNLKQLKETGTCDTSIN